MEGFQEMYEFQSDLSLTFENKEIDVNIHGFEFAKEKMGIVMRTDHPLSNRESVKLEEFKNNTLILLDSNEGNIFNEDLLALFDKRQIKPKEIIYIQQVDTLGLDIQQTGGMSIMPYGVRHMGRSYIKTVPLEDSDCTVSMYFYYRADNENPAILKFL